MAKKRIRLVYRTIGRKGQRYPTRIRELNKRSGVYVIRDRRSKKVLYVGESHSGRLYGTLTRHFQAWRRNRDHIYWGRVTGTTYKREAVQVAVVVCPPREAAKLHYKLIQRLNPRDNQVDGDDVVPF